MKALISAIIAAIVGGIILAIVQAQPQTSPSNAQKFFHDYFGRVTQASQRPKLYQEDLTKAYRQTLNNNYRTYDNWWASVKWVEVRNVQSTSGNKLDFTVWLTYHMRNGTEKGPEAVTYSLVCNSALASVAERIPNGCPVSYLQIESGLQGVPSNP